MKRLKISDELSLPIDAATQTFAWIARKGAGKSYGAGKFAECLLDVSVQVVVLDLIGNWYGLRLSADGKDAAYDIPVIGGLRGDIPLEASGGHLIADIVVDTGRSMIIDLSQFSKADRQRFALAFGERLWARKKAERHPSPVHVIIEESQLIVPESKSSDTAKMVGIYEEIIRLGRNYGIGVTMISQRPQSVNKEVLNQTECLFVLQVNGAHERKALKDWITYHGAEKSLVDELPSLPIGTAYVWSPQWLQILQKVKISKKKSFDASATPTVGKRETRQDLKPLDLDDLKERMVATIEKAKADDPRELRKVKAQLQKRIAELEQKLASAPKVEASIERVEVSVLKEADLSRLESLLSEARGFAADLRSYSTLFTEAANTIASDIAGTKVSPAQPRAAVSARSIVSPSTRAGAPRREVPASSNGHLAPAKQKILNGLAFLDGIGVPVADKTQLALIVGVSPTSGGYFNNLGSLRSEGFIEYPSGGTVGLTDAGRTIASVDGIPSTTGELHDAIRQKLPPAKWKILAALIEVHPDAISKDELAEKIGVSPTSGGYFNNLGSLRSLGLIAYPQPKTAIALPVLFLDR